MRKRLVPLMAAESFFFFGGEMVNFISLESASAGDLSADMVVVCLRLSIDDGFSFSGDGEKNVDYLIGLSFIMPVAFLTQFYTPTIIDDLFCMALLFLLIVSESIFPSRMDALEPLRPSFFSHFFLLYSRSRLDYEISRNVSGSPQTDRLSGLPDLSKRTRS